MTQSASTKQAVKILVINTVAIAMTAPGDAAETVELWLSRKRRAEAMGADVQVRTVGVGFGGEVVEVSSSADDWEPEITRASLLEIGVPARALRIRRDRR